MDPSNPRTRVLVLFGLAFAVVIFLSYRQYRAKRRALLAEADANRKASLAKTINMISQQSQVEGYYYVGSAIDDLKAQALLVMARLAVTPQLCYPNPDTTDKFNANIKNVLVTTFRAKTQNVPAATAMAAINTDNFKLDFTELGLLSLQLELLSQNNTTSIRFITNADGSMSARLDTRTQNFLMLGLFGVLVSYSDLGDNFMKLFIDANIAALDSQYFAGTSNTFMGIANSVRQQMNSGSSVDPTEDARVAEAIQRNIGRPIPLSLIGLILIISMYATEPTWTCPNACVVSEWSPWVMGGTKPSVAIRPIPTYVGTVRSVATAAELTAALGAAIDGDIINVTANISLEAPLTIAKSIRLTAANAALFIGFNLFNNATVLTFTGDNVLVQGITIRAEGAGNTECCLKFTSATAMNNYVNNVTFLTDEYAIMSSNKQIQVTNCSFTHIRGNVNDTHSYIQLNNGDGNTIIANCTFSGSTTGFNNTTCVEFGAGTNYNTKNGIFAFLNNNNTAGNQVQWVFNSPTHIAPTASNITFIIRGNSFRVGDGFFRISAEESTWHALQGIKGIVVENNTEILGAQVNGTGSRGLVYLDVVTNAMMVSIPVWASGNTVQALRSTGVASAMADGSPVVCYNSVRMRYSEPTLTQLMNTDGTIVGITPTKVRTRTVLRAATEGGPACPALIENG